MRRSAGQWFCSAPLVRCPVTTTTIIHPSFILLLLISLIAFLPSFRPPFPSSHLNRFFPFFHFFAATCQHDLTLLLPTTFAPYVVWLTSKTNRHGSNIRILRHYWCDFTFLALIFPRTIQNYLMSSENNPTLEIKLESNLNLGASVSHACLE